MEIIRAEVLGFCSGVRLAVEKAEAALSEVSLQKGFPAGISEPVYTFGPLIHNKIALDDLAKKGLSVITVGTLEKKPRGTVVIRAHGVAPSIEEKIKDSGFKVVNATCPRVIASQKKAADFAKKGYFVILAGDKNHGETIGIKGWAELYGRCVIVENCSDAENLDARDTTKDANAKTEVAAKDNSTLFENPAVFLSQTTFSSSEFKKMAEILKKKFKNLEILETICPATKERQTALENLCKKVDGVIVIGGKNSANSNRLFSTAKSYLSKSAFFIESPDEIENLPSDFFRLEKIGITAGASTPDFLIEETEKTLLAKSRSIVDN